jgi:type I restriction enzyme S subunit
MKEIQIGSLVEECSSWNPAQEAPTAIFEYVDLSAVSQETKSITSSNNILGSDAPSRARQLVRENDVIVSTVRPNLNGVALVDERYCDATVSTGFCVLRPRKGRLNHSYLFHWVRHPEFIRRMTTLATGASYPAVSDRIIKQATIPLPSSEEEQERIAAILDKADAIRRKRQQALRLTDDFLRSVFLDMFGDPVTNPKGWDIEPLEKLTLLDAPMVEPDDQRYENLLHYGPDRIEKDTGRLLPAKTAKEDGMISKKFLCDNRYLLYSKIRPYLNKVALIKQTCLCSADVYPVRPIDETVSREFLWFVLRSASFLGYAASCASRANIPKMNRSEFAAYQCIRPESELQKSFSRIVTKTLAASEAHHLATDASTELFASLQQRAFSGQL